MDRTRILILGGYGFAGQCLAPLLLQETQVSLVVAGRNQEKAERMAAELNSRFPGDRVSSMRVDAADYVYRNSRGGLFTTIPRWLG